MKAIKSGVKVKRGGKGRGHLYKRASDGKEHPASWNGAGSFWLSYTVPDPDGGPGRRKREALHDPAGNPITDRADAEAARMRVVAPFMARDHREAQRQLLARVQAAEVAVAVADDQALPPLTVAGAWDAFLASPARPDSGESTLKQYESEMRRLVRWLEERHPTVKHIRDVTTDHAGAYAAHLTAAKVAPGTFNQHLNLLALLWRVTLKASRATVNPWDAITRKRLQKHETKRRALTDEQFTSLLCSALPDQDLHDLLLLLGRTGLRLADGVHLRWGDVDFSRGVITVIPRKTARRQGKQVFIPLLWPDLTDAMNKRQGGIVRPRALVFPELAEEYDRDNSAIVKRLGRVFELAGMKTTEARAGRARGVTVFGAHSLRHYFVTTAAAAGIPDVIIKSITGHGSDQMLEHYQQIGADSVSRSVAAAGKVKALPPADGLATGQRGDDWRAAVRSIADGLTTRTVKASRAALLALAEGGAR